VVTVTKDDLKQIVMLGYLNDEMIDQLTPISESKNYPAGDIVFHQGDEAERFYMVRQGKVLLEQRIESHITVSLSAIRPGYSFGWSAMLDDEVYSTDALCDEDSRLLSFKAQDLKALFETNHSLGYIMSQRLLRVIKKRYDIRTEQFIRAIRHHPDIGNLL
jgi:CRP-like cAMP-binding protein